MWAAMSDEELVSSSELIVIGEWIEYPSIKGNAVSGSGAIAISKVLKGKATASVSVAQTPGTAPHSSTDLIFHAGDRGLWLLRQMPENKEIYLIDHPQRFVPAAGGEERIRALTRLISP